MQTVAAQDDGTSPPRGRHRQTANKGPAPSEPAKPEPGKPEPGKPESAKPEPANLNPAKPEPDFGAFEPWSLEPQELQFGKPPTGAAEPARTHDSAPPGELVGVGGGARTGLSQQAGGKPAANIRSDTMPDFRPKPGGFDPAWTEDSGLGAPRASVGAALERLLNIRGWPLGVVLAIQAALSLRLIWSTTAFIDEGLYLSVGHLELNHFLHHAAMPNVASFMSGSPVVYPPVAALADDIGGLAGARLLSLAFMLVATTALHGVTKRLLGSRLAAFFAAGLFAWLGTAQFLGAFATYDAMALMLLTLATWLGVRAVEIDNPGLRYTLVCSAGLCMAVADAAKYAAALFNPVVIVVVALVAWRADGRKAALDTAGAMLLTAALPLTVGYDLGGSQYAQGISSTTLERAASTATVKQVLDLSGHTTGIIAVLAVLGGLLITVRRPGWITVLLAWALVGADFLAPAEQARIHTLTSLFKHVTYGAWFACVIGGYLLAELPALLARLGMVAKVAGSDARPRWALMVGTAIGTVVVLAAGAFGVTVANGQYDTWPNSRAMIADLSKLVRPTGIYLVEDPNVVTYYLRTKVPFENIDDTYVFSYTDPQTHQQLINDPAYADAIKRGYFAGIVLAFGDTFATDQVIVNDIDQDHTYRLVDVVPYRDSYGPSQYKIWLRVPQPVRTAHAKHRDHKR
jgi:Dolichyl-phosphate-mannose-protein mannosyltransferase